MKNVANGTDVRLFAHKLYLLSYCSLFTKVCYGTRHYRSWLSACLYFLKWFCFLFSYSTAANYSCSLFYFNPQSSPFSLGFAFSHAFYYSFYSRIPAISIQPLTKKFNIQVISQVLLTNTVSQIFKLFLPVPYRIVLHFPLQLVLVTCIAFGS